MLFSISRPARWAVCLAAAVLITACAPQHGPQRGGGRGGPGGAPDGVHGGFRGGLIVRPIALVFADFDLNHDRTVSETEFAAGAATAWDEADANADGGVTPFEFADWALAAMGAENPNPGRIAFDRNLDTRITRDEFLDTLAFEFSALDANHDGVVARAEMVRMVEVSGPRRNGNGQSSQRPSGGRGGGGPPGGQRPRVSAD